MSNKVYDILKWITLVFLPALTTLTGVILNCFNVGCTDIVLTIMTAVTTFMGAVLGISNINYKKGEQFMEDNKEEIILSPKETMDNFISKREELESRAKHRD